MSKKGEVSTLLLLGTLAVIGITTLVTSTLNQSRKTTSTQASPPAVCAPGVGAGNSCSNQGEFCLICTGNRGPCASDAGVSIPLQCQNNTWVNTNPYGECNVACVPASVPPNNPVPTSTPLPQYPPNNPPPSTCTVAPPGWVCRGDGAVADSVAQATFCGQYASQGLDAAEEWRRQHAGPRGIEFCNVGQATVPTVTPVVTNTPLPTPFGASPRPPTSTPIPTFTPAAGGSANPTRLPSSTPVVTQPVVSSSPETPNVPSANSVRLDIRVAFGNTECSYNLRRIDSIVMQNNTELEANFSTSSPLLLQFDATPGSISVRSIISFSPQDDPNILFRFTDIQQKEIVLGSNTIVQDITVQKDCNSLDLSDYTRSAFSVGTPLNQKNFSGVAPNGDANQCRQYTLANFGCGPTSMAMIMGRSTPVELWNQIAEAGEPQFYCRDIGGIEAGTSGTSLSGLVWLARQNGMNASFEVFPNTGYPVNDARSQKKYKELIARAMNQGKRIIANTNQGEGHLVVISEVTQNGDVWVYDSYFRPGSRTKLLDGEILIIGFITL